MPNHPPAFAACTVGIAPMRSEPSHRAEQTSQVLFGERVQILEAGEGSWQRVRCVADRYEGWVQSVQFTTVHRSIGARGAKWYAMGADCRIVAESGAAFSIPAGSELWMLRTGKIDFGGVQGTYRGGKLATAKCTFSPEAVEKWSNLFRGAPYLWGGRTPAGVDCSGLAQMVGRFCGLSLPRDAWQQAETGEEVSFLETAKTGDLAFFDNDAGRIVHVGILLSPDTILHATETSGRVVQDRIDPGGIISVTQKKRTHKLRVIRRIAGDSPAKNGMDNVLFSQG